MPPTRTLVVSDCLDTSFGEVKLKQKGSHGGHNGLRSIIAHFGGDTSFPRLKVGIGRWVAAKVVGESHLCILGTWHIHLRPPNMCKVLQVCCLLVREVRLHVQHKHAKVLEASKIVRKILCCQVLEVRHKSEKLKYNR